MDIENNKNMVNLKKLQKELEDDGFYDNISLKICDKPIEKDISITIPDECEDRISEIKKINQIGDFDIYISPCRIGRKSNYCSKKIENCEIIDNNIICPICSVLNKSIVNPCYALNKLKNIKLSDNFILIPNAYPYLENQFLITTKIHQLQMDVFENEENIKQLFQIFLNLLSIENDDAIFFNGICGNSLEHFHCQYTTTQFPFFQKISKSFSGIYDQNLLRGYVINTYDYNDIFDIIKKINNVKLTYNFIVRKSEDNKLQFIFFIRYCVIQPGIIDLNFGSTELAGVIVSNEVFDNTLQDIENYINTTNRLDDYNIVLKTKGGFLHRKKNKKQSKKRNKCKKNKKSRKHI